MTLLFLLAHAAPLLTLKALRVHVPKWYILWPEGNPYLGTLAPKYILFSTPGWRFDSKP